jgi:signal transduction histidine kinase
MIETNDLRKIAVFSDLLEDQLAWLIRQAEEIRVDRGEALIHEGEPAEHMFIFLEGELRARNEKSNDQLYFSAKAGDVTGLLPFSRLQTFQATGRAVEPMRVVRLHKRNFPEMLQRMPVLTERLVALMLDRVRESTKESDQRDKLAALGKLSAGLAHELNNPAAAVKRAAGAIMEVRKELRASYLRLDQRSFTREQRTYIADCEERAIQVIQNTDVTPLSALERSDREQELEQWLQSHAVPEPWKIAATLAEAGFNPAKLQEILAVVGAEALHEVLSRVNYALLAARMVKEIDQSATRIFDLVQAVKQYTYMDQAPEQEIDIHTGIESTLTILAYKLRTKSINVERDYDRSIPKICAYAVELNQVWTNLIVNAIDAMSSGGVLRIRTCDGPRDVVVEVQDNGSGIPVEIMPRIFEPFFTTKGVGEGTGLGLDTAMRVVRKHRGDLSVKSKPGVTVFRVSIPKSTAAQRAS